jgi:hypothetical protein
VVALGAGMIKGRHRGLIRGTHVRTNTTAEWHTAKSIAAT